MPFISSIRGKFSAIGGRAASGPIITPVVASSSGNIITASAGTVNGAYRYHIFTGPGTFTVTGGGDVEVVVVGGGGGGGPGGDSGGAGGGGGGLVYGEAVPVSVTSYPITIGGGGGNATGGGNSTAFGFNAIGGGGGSGRTFPGGPGGNGGGGANYTSGAANPGPGTQPGQPQPAALTYQIGNPGFGGPGGIPPWWTPGSGYLSPASHFGGSSNPTNHAGLNPTFPNGSTIISGSPVAPSAVGRGGGFQYGGGGYGGGGAGQLSTGSAGTGGICIIRYPN